MWWIWSFKFWYLYGSPLDARPRFSLSSPSSLLSHPFSRIASLLHFIYPCIWYGLWRRTSSSSTSSWDVLMNCGWDRIIGNIRRIRDRQNMDADKSPATQLLIQLFKLDLDALDTACCLKLVAGFTWVCASAKQFQERARFWWGGQSCNIFGQKSLLTWWSLAWVISLSIFSIYLSLSFSLTAYDGVLSK